ncbi:telomerase protein component 1 isoform X2 [Sceloporus undulatus]|uniref:telomerase protein component 1 isoform X2 n=1 Tax=Sceloporus undulatus TaxID=8520 RepID=UPI001C4C13CA|nr:telomerase protein component 1 isoform X2 [Sceloporus undulatus]
MENSLLHASSPVSLTLQSLEESRARLLRPISPSASWVTKLNSSGTQSQPVPGHQGTAGALSFQNVKHSGWVSKPAQGLEESRAHLLRPIAITAAKLPPLESSGLQFRFQLDPPDNLVVQTCPGLLPGYEAQENILKSSRELEQLQCQKEGTMPEYVLTIPEDKLKVPQEESDLSGDELPLESEEQSVKEQKLMLLSMVCCSLVEGPKFGNPPGELQQTLTQVCKSLAEHEPEFILKVALYTRRELNIRSTANFLLALSSHILLCRPHLRRYFCHAVQLPSDWMEVARIYQSLAGGGETLAPMPSCLRASMADKFRQFDAYQLAKYNTQKSRGKKRCRRKTKKQRPEDSRKNEQKKSSGTTNISNAEALQKILQEHMYSKKERPAPPKQLFSLKALIQRLHISEPAQHVMSLLGRRYPSDLHAFSRSRLPGPWDSHLAGTRMKLPKPNTWDRELSQRGNYAMVWEDLIGDGKLPFMAMLRNLRNILRSGVSERCHKRLLKRLEDKESVIRSKQLPFRFLAAYKVLWGLEKDLREKDTPFPTVGKIIQQILNQFGLRLPGKPIRTWTGQDLRQCMQIPMIANLVMLKKKKLRKARCVYYSQDILERYRQALETAIHISVRHNLPPIPGRTLILISCAQEMYSTYMRAKELCCPGGAHEYRTSESPTKLEVAMLLGSMVYSAAEEAQLLLCDQYKVLEPVAMTGSVLKDVQTLKSLGIRCLDERKRTASDIVMDLLIQRQHVDTILLLSNHPESLHGSCLWLYRDRVSPGCLFVNVCAQAVGLRTFGCRNEVVMGGFSEQVLRFMAECGDSRLLEHVGKVDEIHGLPKQWDIMVAKKETGVVSLIPAPKTRWCSVRIFVSSTFRDMHGERDLLIRSVFPELRARAAQFCLAIEDIDLRWGITEHESQRNRQLELCLSEVSQSQLFIGLLGERYGHIPRQYSLPDEPQYEWVKSYPAGRSITELEALQFLTGGKDPTAGSRAFFYMREPDFLGSVPEAWKVDFLAESETAKSRVADLKDRLEKHEGLASLSKYVCQWGGVAQGRPFVKGLEEFGTKVLQDVWECLLHQFIQRDDLTLDDYLEEEEEDQNILQESFQELQQKRFCARAKLLQMTTAQLHGGKLYIVNGEPGQGKTVFLAALAQELRTKTLTQGEGLTPSYNIVAHFTRARPDQAEVHVVLGRLCGLLRRYLKESPALARSYRGLVGQFECLLHSVAQLLKRGQSLVILIDGADLIHAASGQLVSDWLPEQLPQRVIFVLSVSEESTLLGSLKRRTDAVPISLGPLDPHDRAAVVRKDLALYGKKLEESAFNNQMRLVLLKRGSRQPLYLTLLTQDLRLFALYEKLSERIQKLPVSLPLLLQHLLGCLEEDHGSEQVAVALVSLWASRDGLTKQDLYGILATWKELNVAGVTFEEAIVAGRQAGSYPVGPFLDFLRSLRGLLGACGSPSESSDSRLHLYDTPLKTAVERRYLKKPGLDRTAHVLLAAHWWKLADPDGTRTFQNCEAEPLRALPYHLVQSGLFNILASFLTDLRVVSAHVRLGLLHRLSEAYALYETTAGSERDETVDFFHAFLQRNIGLLSQNPLLLLQQAANEPDSSDLCSQAQTALSSNKRPFLKWMNKPEKSQKTNSLTQTLPATPSCISISPSGKLAAVGTTEGNVHLLDVETGQELKSLLSTCDGVSACAFLSETTVCLGAFSGRLELWSLREGCRLMGKDAHKNQVTDCCISPDRRLLATVSLDGYLKLWDTIQSHQTHQRDSLCPLNCVTFHPKGQLVATGGWDKTVTILDASDMRVISVMKGHDASIHSISFSSAGNILAVGSLAGSIHLWSWQESVTIGTFLAHSGSVSSALFLSGGKLLTTGEDCKVQLWAGHLGKFCGTLGSTSLSPALCVVPSLDGFQLAVGHHSDDVWIYRYPWDASIGATHCQAGGVAICSLAWLDSLFLIGGRNDGSLCIWNTSQVRPSCLKLRGHEKPVTGLAVFKKLVASTSEDFTVCLWLSEALKPAPGATDTSISPLAVLRGHTSGVTCCAFSLDGCYLATGGKDRALFIWDVKESAQKTATLWRSLPFCHQDWISSCAWAGAMLLSGSNDGTVCLWDPKTSQRLQEFLGHQSPVSGVTSEKDHVISMGRDGLLVAWDLQGVEKTRFVAHPGRANHCAGFSNPREKEFTLAAAGYDGTVKLWKPLMMEQPQVLSGHCGAVCNSAASPTSFLTISKDNTVRIWGLSKKEGEFPPHSGAITALAWSPDGEFAASGGERGDLIVWQRARASGREKVGSCFISALAFTSSNTIIVAADRISLWELNPSGQKDGAVRLIVRKQLRQAGETSVLCMGMPRPHGSLVLGLANDGLMVLQPGTETRSKRSKRRRGHLTKGEVQDEKVRLSFDISASEEEGILHIWDSMDRPNLLKMKVTGSGELEDAQEPEHIPWTPDKNSSWVTVARLVKDKFLFYADSEGSLWTQTQQNEEGESRWKADGWRRRKIHSAKITALHILGDKIVTGSHDRDVKIWEGNTMKLLGQFRCHAPVSHLQPCPRMDSPLLLMAGDTLGNIYFLEWNCLRG